MVAEKTAKNFRGLLFCRSLYIESSLALNADIIVSAKW